MFVSFVSKVNKGFVNSNCNKSIGLLVKYMFN